MNVTSGFLILIFFLPTNWNWQFFVNSNNYTTLFWTSCHRYINHCTQNCAQPQPLPPLLGLWVQLKLCMWSSQPLMWLTSQVQARPARFGMQSMSDATTINSCRPPCICPSSFNLNSLITNNNSSSTSIATKINKRYQTWSWSFHSHLAHFSCLNQGSTIISNSTKPPLGIRAVFRDDDHKYLVPIYNHSYHKVKYPVLISNHDFQFLGFWVRGFRFWKLDNKMYLRKEFRKL